MKLERPQTKFIQAVNPDDIQPLIQGVVNSGWFRNARVGFSYQKSRTKLDTGLSEDCWSERTNFYQYQASRE